MTNLLQQAIDRNDGDPAASTVPTHKFKIGQTVFIRSLHLNITSGGYIVVQRMPEHDGKLQYRVRSSSDPHERVVSESELIT